MPVSSGPTKQRQRQEKLANLVDSAQYESRPKARLVRTHSSPTITISKKYNILLSTTTTTGQPKKRSTCYRLQPSCSQPISLVQSGKSTTTAPQNPKCCHSTGNEKKNVKNNWSTHLQTALKERSKQSAVLSPCPRLPRRRTPLNYGTQN